MRLAIVGLGNPEAGDDAVGPAVIQWLVSRCAPRPDVLVTRLVGDLFGLSDFVERAERLILVDAILDPPAGRLIVGATSFSPEARPVSQHQTDVITVMRTLEALALRQPFPDWSVWGVTIETLPRLDQALTDPVRRGVELLGERLAAVCASGRE